jgi:hypothetical protein
MHCRKTTKKPRKLGLRQIRRILRIAGAAQAKNLSGRVRTRGAFSCPSKETIEEMMNFVVKDTGKAES